MIGEIFIRSKIISKIGVETEAVPPWLLSLEDCIKRQKQRAENYVKNGLNVGHLISEKMLAISAPAEKPKKLKIGYFSADFHIFRACF